MANDPFFKKIDLQKRFETQIEGKSQEEVRKIEQSMLKPAKVTKYTGDLPKFKSKLDSLSVSIVFPSQAEMDMFRRHMTISVNVKSEQYITNIDFLLKLIREYEKAEQAGEATNESTT